MLFDEVKQNTENNNNKKEKKRYRTFIRFNIFNLITILYLFTLLLERKNYPKQIQILTTKITSIGEYKTLTAHFSKNCE